GPPRFCYVAIEDCQWVAGGCLLLTVQAPVAGENVQLAVLVEVARSYAGPEAGKLTKSLEFGVWSLEWRVPRDQLAVFVSKHFERTPFTGEHPFGKAVASGRSPDGAVEQANRC